MTEKDVFENKDKYFYIIDCKDFIFYVRKVEIIGFETYSSWPVHFTINLVDHLGENRTVSAEMLFLNFKDAKDLADKLNNNKENKKRAKEWNSYENRKRRLEMEVF